MKKIVFALTIAAASIAAWFTYQATRQTNDEHIVASSTHQQSSATTEELDARLGMKLYRNEEFGFEFWYPEGWDTREEPGGNPYNKFIVYAYQPYPNGKYPFFNPLEVIVTTKGHADEILASMRPGETLTTTHVGGVTAMRDEYDEEVHYITYVVSTDDGRYFLIGNDNREYVPEFEQILATFQFLR